MATLDPATRCQSLTDGVKYGRLWYHKPRPCKNAPVRGFTRCRVHISGKEAVAWYQQRGAAQAATSEAST